MDAQAEALAESFPEGAQVAESAPESSVRPDLLRQRAGQEEISKLVKQLPERIREQMDDLFRARYTRIQILDLDKLD